MKAFYWNNWMNSKASHLWPIYTYVQRSLQRYDYHFLSFCLQLTTSIQNNISIICITYDLISFEVKTFFFLYIYNAKWKAAVPWKFTHFPIAIKLPFYRYGIPKTLYKCLIIIIICYVRAKLYTDTIAQ